MPPASAFPGAGEWRIIDVMQPSTSTVSDARCHAGTVHHVSFRVDDLEEALAFYVGILGCSTVDRPSTAIGKGAWLQAGGTQVHLMECPADEASGSPATEVVPYANHVAFHTDDIEAAEAGFRDRGLHVRTSRSGLPQFFVADPTGNVIEFTAY